MATVLPLPNLDDRRWQDLVDEGRALIPFYAPTWTDHNAHDPGITLMELFAWIAEMDVYSVNQITDVHRRKLLALAGITPQPPRPARTILDLRLAPGTPARSLPAGLEFEGRDPFGAVVRFRALHDVTVQPGRLAAVLTGAGAPLQDLTAAWQRGEPVRPFGPDPRPGAALYLGFDLPAPWPAGTVVSLGFAPADPDGRSGTGERDRIAGEALGADPPTAAVGRLAHHSVRLIWEVLTGPDRWTRLNPPDDVDDDTRALTLDGRVVLTLPARAAIRALDSHHGPLAWVRARLVRGAYDAAPVVRGLAFNAVAAVQAVPAWVALRIAPGAPVTGSPPAPGDLVTLDLGLNGRGEIDRLRFGPADDGSAVRVQAYDPVGRTLTIEAGAVRRGTGGPLQLIEVPGAPVVAESLRLASLENGAWRRWSLRPDFDTSSRADAHAVLDATSGAVVVGDGEHGRVAPADATLLVTADLTRADGGNLAAGGVDRLADSRHNRAVVADLAGLITELAGVANVVAAAGGSAAESVAGAIARARDGREQAARAVTLDDHAALAAQTPGVRVARAQARANLHPGFPCLTAPGVVTVLIVPHLPAGRPTPSPGLRRAVAGYLNRRRVLGTRVEVTGPGYVTVTVRATVAPCAGARPADLPPAVRDALDRFFDPLTGGPDATGWPFGRDVYRAEVLKVIDEVPGVAHVLALELVADDGAPSCGNLCVGPTGLVDPGPHEIDVR